jgi:16S rRNA (cytosine967-C5)-methyltransferase
LLKYFHSHITSAITIIETAKQAEPLAFHLKRFFAADKKFGSKDRKNIATLCYNYYRLGHALKNKTIEEKILAAIFLCNSTSNNLLEEKAPQFHTNIQLSISEKCVLLGIKEDTIFPCINEIGGDVDVASFVHSFFIQPLLYLRIRAGKAFVVKEKLLNAKVDYTLLGNDCIVLPAATKIAEVLAINEDVVVQDYNSQQVFNYLKNNISTVDDFPTVWDCCAASGGKSILMNDIFNGAVQLNVSDVRANMLNNLRTRFKEAGIKKYNAFVADLINSTTIKQIEKYDIIICDAPCTGSGTWARTPEQVSSFEKYTINNFVQMQQKIASTAMQSLKKEGLFFYITCSVFKKENEEVVDYLAKKFHLQVVQMEYLKGYEMQADTMFVAVLSF